MSVHNYIKLFNFKSSSLNSVIDFLSFLLFLFFIQQITFLVESIYILDLLHTSIDSKAFGILFLAMPMFLFFVKPARINYIILVSVMLLSVLLSPVLPTSMRIVSSGLAAGLFLLWFAMQFSDKNMPEANWGQAAALAVLASAAFRAAGHSLDISVSGNTKFIGWLLVSFAIALFYLIIKKYPFQNNTKSVDIRGGSEVSMWFSVFGLAGSILLIYFAFSSPAVMARWTEGNYFGIHIVFCVSILIFIVFGSKILHYSRLKELLLVWNSIFIVLLIWNFLIHRVSFPSSPESAPVIVGETNFYSQLITYLMLTFSPVIFINITLFAFKIKGIRPAKLATPFLTAAIIMVLCIFMLILSNVWGYVNPVSNIFRNQFYLPFAVAAILTLLPHFFNQHTQPDLYSGISFPTGSKFLSILLVGICFGAIYPANEKRIEFKNTDKHELTVMTYNIQQGVDLFGNKNYEGQLATIVEINPDIICLQESDVTRISGGNNDVVRYFAENLGFFSYYGPKTVTGTFGTAILSRFPLDFCRTIFTYSNKDEIGTTVSNVTVGNQEITIINSHPAGNNKAREAHINEVVNLAKTDIMVIAAGDYNFDQESPWYKKIARVLNNAWQTKYPDAIGPVDTNKLDLSFEERKSSSGILLPDGKIDMKDRIDHIFLSKVFELAEAHFLPAPESDTDHPVHWVVVRW